MSQAGAADNSITVGRDATNSVITSGNENTVIVYQTVAVATPLASGDNPYVGLLAFAEKDADRFFGRDELVGSLWERFRGLIGSPADKTPHFLAILGPSGSGKSSLARAGLVPELERRPVSPQQRRVATMTPGPHPMQALAFLLSRVAPSDLVEDMAKEAELLAQQPAEKQQPAKRQKPPALRRIAESLRANGQALVLLIDQFEEIYSLCQDDAERKIFIDNLLEAASDPAGCLSVIVTLRSDFLDKTQADSRLNQLIATQSVIVPAMSPEELRLAIAQPAIRAGHPIDEDTIQRLVAETEGRDGALPLLQLLLVQIWKGMEDGHTARATVDKLGGVGGALGTVAERIYLERGADEKIIAERAFLAMVKFNENGRPTRRRALLSELVKDGDGPNQVQAINGVVSAFAQWDARLVTMAATAQGDQTIEVTHEAIFEHWDTLRTWLTESMDDIRLNVRATDAAGRWDSNGRLEDLLWRPPDLDLLRDLASSPTFTLSAVVKAFYLASKQALESKRATARRRELAVRIATGVFLVLFLAAGGLFYDASVQSQKAELQRSNAFAGASRQAIDAGEITRGLLLGLEGAPPGRLDSPGFESASAAVRAALANLSEVHAFVHPGPVDTALFAAGDRRVVTVAGDTVRIWHINGKLITTIPGFQKFAASPDGRRLATLQKGQVHIWNAETGTQIATITEPDVNFLSFSPDGSRLAIARTKLSAGIWSADTGAALLLLDTTADALFYLPNGRDLLSISSEGPDQLWDATTGLKRGAPLQGIAGDGEAPVFAQGGRIVALNAEGGMRHPLGLWSLPEGKFITTMAPDYIYPVFSPDGSILAVKNDNQEVHLLTSGLNSGGSKVTDLYSKDRGAAKATDGVVNDYAFSFDGRWLAIASGGQTVSLWNVKDGMSLERVLLGHTGPVEHVQFSRDGRFILSASADGTARLWRTTPGLGNESHTTRLPSAADPAIPVRLLSFTNDQGVQIWERMTGRLVASAIKSSDEGAVISPDGDKFFTSAHDDKNVRQLNTVTGAVAGPAFPANDSVSLALSPDGSKLVISSGNTSQLWDVSSGKADGPSFPGDVVSGAAVSADGRIAVANEFWDMVSPVIVEIRTPSKSAPVRLKGNAQRVSALSFAHKGDDVVILSHDRTGRIWNSKTAQPGPIFRVDTRSSDPFADSAPARAEHSPDDRQILTVFGNIAEVWDAKTGQQLMRLPYDAQTAGWSPDGRKILVITPQGPQLANVNFLYGEALRTEACRSLPRDFTADERLSYGLTEAEKSCSTASRWPWRLNFLHK